MKFICENCKAKYQIGDDKIAGRSVRMKCRRCGHLIQLSASVTEASHESDHAVVDTSFVETGSSSSIHTSSLLGGAHNHAAAVAQLREEPEEEATRAMTREQRAALGVREAQTAPAPQPARAVVARPAPAPVAPSAPRAPLGAPAPAQRPLPGAPLGGAPAAPRAPLGAPAPAARPLGAPAPAVRSAPSAGVAGAFQKTLAEGTAPSEAHKAPTSGHVPHGEDWYVGVGGVPLGPVRLAVIREKALAGAVHAESLVWREGFDEWQPLKNFPELLQIVEEAQAQRRPSTLPRAPTSGPHAPSAPRPLGVTAPSPLGAKPPGPAAPFQPKATAVGVGIPAVTLPGAAKPAGPGVPSTPLGARAPLGPPAPLAPPPSMGRSPLGPPAARPSAVPAEPARPASLPRPAEGAAGLGLRPEPLSSTVVSPGTAPAPHAPAAHAPVAHAPAPHAPATHAGHTPAPLHAHAAVPAPAPTPLPAAARAPAPSSPDLFGGAVAPSPAPAPVAVPAPPASTATPAASSPDPLAAGVASSAAALDVMRDPFAAAAGDRVTSEGFGRPSVEGRSGIEKRSGADASRASSASLDAANQEPASEAPLMIAGLGGSRRRGMHPIVYAFIAMAGLFGAVAAYMIFQKPAQPTIVYVQASGSPTGASAPGTAAPDQPTAQAPADVPTTDATSGQPRVVTGGGSGPGPKPTSSGSSAPLDTSGFGNQVVPPPVATATATGPDPSMSQLSAGEIQGVVSSNQSRVRKRCWQPALDSAGPNAPGSARVQGRITIGASGSVESATASGSEKDYPGLSSCIAGQMKTWKFPPSGGSTPVNVPFVFAGQ
ncbi:MAG: GYF domain-containing protein [Polyangiaceae bacterium]